MINFSSSMIIGWEGEDKVDRILREQKEKFDYISNLYLEVNNITCQIDFIVPTIYGIYVIEVKNISGTVVTNEDSVYWKVVNNGRTSNIYNPLLQNSSHIRYLKKTLGSNLEYKSIIVFPDETVVRGNVNDVYRFSDLWDLDDLASEQVYSQEQVRDLVDTLKKMVIANENLCFKHDIQQKEKILRKSKRGGKK